MTHTVASMIGRTRRFDGTIHAYTFTVTRDGKAFHVWHDTVTGSVWQTPAK